jgi:hypothetical protein
VCHVEANLDIVVETATSGKCFTQLSDRNLALGRVSQDGYRGRGSIN